MINAKRKARLNEIKKLKAEIKALGGKVEYDSKDLDKIEKKMYDLKFEQSGLKCQNTKILKQTGKFSRLQKLNEIIPKLEVQLRLDRTNLEFKKNNKLSGNVREGFSVKKIGKSKVTLFNY